MHFLLWLVLGLIAGGIASYLVPGRTPGGTIGALVVGLLGGLLGGWILDALGVGHNLSWIGPLGTGGETASAACTDNSGRTVTYFSFGGSERFGAAGIGRAGEARPSSGPSRRPTAGAREVTGPARRCSLTRR